MIRRLLPWAFLGILLAVVFFVGAMVWRAWQLPEELDASVTGRVEAPAAAVWLALNTANVLKDRFDDVEFQDVIEDGRGLAEWTSLQEDRGYLTRYIRTRSVEPLNGQRGVYAYKITPEDVPIFTTRKVEMREDDQGVTTIKVSDDMRVPDRQMRVWMGILGIDGGAKNELNSITDLALSAKVALEQQNAK